MGVIVICSQLYNTLKASVPGLRAVIIISLRYSGLLLLHCVCMCVISVSLAQVSWSSASSVSMISISLGYSGLLLLLFL